jgi:hypothetical protein
MSAHTPEPWIMDDGDGEYVGICAQSTGEPIAYVVQPKSGLNAHARLIAAAPEMYTALLFLIDSASLVAGQSSMGHLLKADIERARVAFAKAVQS